MIYAHAAPCLHDAGAGSVQKMPGNFWAMAGKALDAVAAGTVPRLTCCCSSVQSSVFTGLQQLLGTLRPAWLQFMFSMGAC